MPVTDQSTLMTDAIPKEAYELKDDELVEFAEEVYKMYAHDRMPFGRMAISNDKFYSGNHVKYKNGAATSIPQYPDVPPAPLVRSIPITTILLNTKITQMLSNPPIPVISEKVDADDPDKARAIAVAIQKKLEAVMDENYMYIVNHKWLQDTSLHHVGWTQLYSDNSGIHWKNREFEEVLVYPKIQDIEDSPLIGIKFTGILNHFANDKNYFNIDKLKPITSKEDKEVSAYTKAESPRSYGHIPLKGLNTFEGCEFQMKVELNEKNIKTLSNKSFHGKKFGWIANKQPGDQIIFIFSVAQNNVIRQSFIDTDNYHLYPLTFDPGELYGISMFYRGISTNKSIDNIVSQIEFYAATALKYRLLVPRTANISDVDNTSGLEIEYDGEVEPRELQHSDIPQGLFTYLQELVGLLNLIFQISPQSTEGSTGSGAKKFKANESAKETDMFNNGPALERFKIALTKVTKGMLDLMANSLREEDFVYEYKNEEGKNAVQKVHLVGERYYNENKNTFEDENGQPLDLPYENIVIVRHDYPVDVEIQNGLSYTSDGVRSIMVDLVKQQILPPEILEDVFAYGKILEFIDMQNKRNAKSGENAQSNAIQLKLAGQPSIPKPQGQLQAGGVPPSGTPKPQVGGQMPIAGAQPIQSQPQAAPQMATPQMGGQPRLPANNTGIPQAGKSAKLMQIISEIAQANPNQAAQTTPQTPQQ